MFDLMQQVRLCDLHFKHDPHTGLKAIIAIHSTKHGPALGGCRFIEYPNTDQAVKDAALLAKGMSYKAALADIPQGGGKAVIMKPKNLKDRRALFEAFGDFIEELGGRYLTAVDSGTTSDDMDIIAGRTRFVTSTTLSGNPSPYTAQGVVAGIKSAVKHRLQRTDMQDIHVAIQGLGSVGQSVAEHLAKAGARLSVTDIDAEKVEAVCDQFKATPIAPEDFFSLDCDVLTPCALGNVVNASTISQFNCKVIAGSANNQLSDERWGHALHERNILYAPDFAINAGGLIFASMHHRHMDDSAIAKQVDHIGVTLSDIFTQSEHSQQATNVIANKLAEAKLYIRGNQASPHSQHQWPQEKGHAVSNPHAVH
ncbi:Glu/Leu/Phe/Val dehydrogenase [Maricurvus nonylphenolicus]|uniref:Leu/Phe/Val dehydrogenase n=1 Tax=Maricurvus nonylphenolicus TaxID=1008307 RepID=UPI0036F4313A